ncbi:hypothetical protein V500_11316 [Pseudogymnoascus sp. VKM F-4518 (FW-2643)]|nr:hypothetical protein V500_11316 [Pseudogymnoascus sp. VKM F-4518 (FW-2643)]
MSLSWFNGAWGDHSQRTLPTLISSYLKSSDTYIAVTETFYLVNILILSNHIEKADELVNAVCYYRAKILSAPSSNVSTPVLEYFWQTNIVRIYPHVDKEVYEAFVKEITPTREGRLAKEQWGQYRESCRTDWMIEHLSVAEPKDPHIWREIDDPVMLAMCCRLLAREETPGVYPPQERMREALAAAMKLYAQPQGPIEEGVDYSSTQAWKSRHSFLLYRRLAIELAIRVGELELASEILSMALRLDGFGRSSGASLQDFLFVPGIYDVLPLLAEGGKKSNPFFIEEEDANILVDAILSAVELRATEGRSWTLPPTEAGWKELMERLSKGAWLINSTEYKNIGLECAADILFPPATEAEIEAVEKDIGSLPADLKDMVRISNGYRGGWHFLGGGMTGIQDIFQSGYALKEVEDHFYDRGLKKTEGDYSGFVLQLAPASVCDGCEHFIIPPAMWKANGEESVKDGEYKYWHSANWRRPTIWNSVRDSIVDHVEYIETMIEEHLMEDDDS